MTPCCMGLKEADCGCLGQFAAEMEGTLKGWVERSFGDVWIKTDIDIRIKGMMIILKLDSFIQIRHSCFAFAAWLL